MLIEGKLDNRLRWQQPELRATRDINLSSNPALVSPLSPTISKVIPDTNKIKARTCSEASCATALGELLRPSSNTMANQCPDSQAVSVQPITRNDSLHIRLTEQLAPMFNPQRDRLPSIHQLVGDMSPQYEHGLFDWQASRHSSFSSTTSSGTPLYQLPPPSPSSSSTFSFVGSNSYSTACTSPAGSWQSGAGFPSSFQPSGLQDKFANYVPASHSASDIRSCHHKGFDRAYFSARRSSRQEPYPSSRRGSVQEPYSTLNRDSRASSSTDLGEDWIMVHEPQVCLPTQEKPGSILNPGCPSAKMKRHNISYGAGKEPKKRDNTSYTFEQEIFIIYHVVDLSLPWAEVEKRYNLWFHDPGLVRNQAGLTCEYYRTNLTMPLIKPNGLLDLGPFRIGEKDISKPYKGARYRTNQRKCRRVKVPLAMRFPEELIDPRNLWVLREHREDPYVIQLAAARKAQREEFLLQYPQIIHR